VFRAATASARGFTKPVVASSRRWDGTVESGCGAFIVLNDEGWIVSVAHMLNVAQQRASDADAIRDHEAQLSAVDARTDLTPKQRARESGRIRRQANPKWVRDTSYWFSLDGVELIDVSVFREADLVVGRLSRMPPGFTPSFPVFKRPDIGFDQGTSLCRLGFAFPAVASSWDDTTASFRLAESTQLPYFPIDGIFTRIQDAGRTPDGQFPIRQVWGIQSRTVHLPLGFNPTIKVNGRDVTEHQFISLGLGVSTETIIPILESMGVNHQVSDD
jgi:hypothetical protein